MHTRSYRVLAAFVATLAFGAAAGSAQAATFVTDTMTGTSATNLTAHTGETGATWTATTGNTGLVQLSSSGGARETTTTATGKYYASGTPSNANYKVSADLLTRSNYNAETSVSTYVGCRVSTSADTGYYGGYKKGVGWEIIEVTAGTVVSLASTAASLTYPVTHTTELSCDGSNLTLKGDGVTQVTTTDSSITAAGKAGIRLQDAISSFSNGIHIDNVVASDLFGTQATPLNNLDTYSITPQASFPQGGEGPLPPYQWSSTWTSTCGFTTHTDHDPTIEGAAVVADPDTDLSRNVIKLSANESNSPGCGTYVRSEIRGPAVMVAGDEKWVITEIYVPTSTGTMPSGMPFWTVESIYGPPYSGPSPNHFNLKRNVAGTGNDFSWDLASGCAIWRKAATGGVWHILARKIKMSTDPAVGYAEIYYAQRDTSGNMTGPLTLQTVGGTCSIGSTTHRNYATLDSSNNGGTNHVDLKNYHSGGYYSGLNSLYFARHRVYAGSTPVAQLDPYYTGLR